jgi:hypothetical protein
MTVFITPEPRGSRHSDYTITTPSVTKPETSNLRRYYTIDTIPPVTGLDTSVVSSGPLTGPDQGRP